MHLSSIAVFLRCVLLALPLTVHSQTANFNNNNNNNSSNDQMTENKQERSILGIINGHEVPEGKYPFIVSLQSGDRPCGDTQPGYHFCAGTIINDNTILTAAHCLKDEDTSKLAVVVNKGPTGIERASATRWARWFNIPTTRALPDRRLILQYSS